MYWSQKSEIINELNHCLKRFNICGEKLELNITHQTRSHEFKTGMARPTFHQKVVRHTCSFNTYGPKKWYGTCRQAVLVTTGLHITENGFFSMSSVIILCEPFLQI